MAASIYKWLLLTVMTVPGPFHPFHVSVTQIDHNAAEQRLEISCKMFTDDFEAVLSRNYQTKADLAAADKHAEMDKLVSDYLQKNLALVVDAKKVSFNYVGFERENESAFVYIEVDHIPAFKKVDITNKIMYDFYDDQINIMHVTNGGKRKSVRLNYPNETISVSF